MRNPSHILIPALCLALVSAGCDGRQHKVKVATPKMTREQSVRAKNVEVSCVRYDQMLFALDTGRIAAGVKALYGKVPEVLVAKNCWEDSAMMRSLKSYLSDPVVRELYRETQRRFPDLDNTRAKLKGAFKTYLTHFPEDSVPDIVFMVSGLDFSMPSVWGLGNNLFVSLDMYLGPDCPYYASAGMPKFISARCDRKFIPTDCFSKGMAYRHLPDKTPVTALDYMLAEGKRLLLTQTVFPSTPARDIIGYSADKYDWAVQNEGAVWQYLMEKNMIYSKDEDIVRQLVGETPFTRAFGNNSPGRLGAYLGWRILQCYMKQHPETPLRELMRRTDSQNILNESLYKPKFKK